MIDFQANDAWPVDYVAEFTRRSNLLMALRANPALWVGVKEHYKTRPIEFLCDWGMTYDPRNAGTALPTKMPFLLFKRQRDFVQFLLDLLESEENGLVEKCRDMGATWLCVGFSVWMWLFQPGSAVGWGSRKEQLVDKIGDPDSIFEKMRMFIRLLPPELLPKGFKEGDHMAYMRIINPENDATITGEAGDNIGRGGRKRMYFKDESAHYERPEKIEAALADNTRVQVDISSVNGPGNVFHRRRQAGALWKGCGAIAGRTNVFIMDWRDHPGKTQAWYNARRQKAVDDGMLHIFAQEVERNYAAAVENVVIPLEWVMAAIDAHKKIPGFGDDGMWVAGLDVADEGLDKNAFVARKGLVIKLGSEWGERDTGVTTRNTAASCRDIGAYIDVQYDCIGIGAGIKAEVNRLVGEGDMPKTVSFTPWNAAAGVLYPDKPVIEKDKNSPLNKDFYGNLKAQAWWMARRKFERTFRAIHEPGFTFKVDDLVSISSDDIPRDILDKLTSELSQPTFGQGSKMKMIINKTPEGTKSPNLGDAAVMCLWPVNVKKPMIFSDNIMARVAGQRAA